jgi:hypothetical protein
MWVRRRGRATPPYIEPSFAGVRLEALGQSERNGYARFVSYQPEYSLMERAASKSRRCRCASITALA